MRIDALTAEQEARFGEYRDRWTEIGLCTEPANRARAERGIALVYRRGGIAPPSRIVWCGSPLSQGITRAVVQGVGASVRASVVESGGASVGDSVGAGVGASVGGSVGDSVGASVRDTVGASVGDSVRASVGAS